MRSKIYEVYKVSANFVYFVCSASPNTILSQPSADSPFQKGPFLRSSVHFPPIGTAQEIVDTDVEILRQRVQAGDVRVALSLFIEPVSTG